MEQKLHRVVRACVEYGENNPILSIHDQGAGGNGNRHSYISSFYVLFSSLLLFIYLKHILVVCAESCM